ncbi:splicing factor 1 [Anopheles maculipalpis]|uniref:splicing factor 1 n=1 Tax=Anopheles maculipalpis TaxID=1496333 RepID=UPI0021597D57|nr:splicing factor 1 [Anopheles maculipalpis]
MSYKHKGKDRDHESSKSRNNVAGLSKGRDKERERKSETDGKERYLEKGSYSAKERHRSRSRERSSERREVRRSSKERHGSSKHGRTRDDSRERDHRRREHRERRSRSRSRDRKHRSSGGGGISNGGGGGGGSSGSRDDRDHRHRSREHADDTRRTMDGNSHLDSPENYEYKSMEFTQNVISTMLLTAATASDFAKLLNSYNQQQQIQAQQQQIQTQQALFEQHNENSCSSIGSKGENGTGPQALCNGNSSGGEGGESSRRRKKKSRWAGSDHDKTFIPGMPTVLPSTLTPDQQEAYLVQLQIEEISRKLRTGDLMIPQNPEERSPSPEPIYSSDGKRLNTREFRTRKKLEEQRHQLIQRMQSLNPDFKPPSDYKPPVIRVSDKVLIPQEEYPDINFVGLLIGPRGNTLKAMEKDTGAKIIIRGKGSVKEGKVGRKDGQPLPGEDEPLHAFITASNPEAVKKAVDRIKDVIRQGIEVPEGHNDLRRMQLRELAQLNGTLRETDGPRCNNCGSNEHKSWLCPDKPNITNNIVCSACGGTGHIARDCRSKRPGHGGPPSAGGGGSAATKIDEEYMSLMAELGEAPPPQENNHGHGGGGGGERGGAGNGGGGGSRGGYYNLFEPRSVPRPLMATPHHPPSVMSNSMQTSNAGTGTGSQTGSGAVGGGGDGSGGGGSAAGSSNGTGNGHMWPPLLPMPPIPPSLPTPPPPPPSVPSLMQWTPPQPPLPPAGDSMVPAPNHHSYNGGLGALGPMGMGGWGKSWGGMPKGLVPTPPGSAPPPPPSISGMPSHILAPPPPPPPS